MIFIKRLWMRLAGRRCKMEQDESQFCTKCGDPLEWVDCPDCGGDGVREVYEEDPLWYDPGDTEPCNPCLGQGGWWECPNAARHFREAQDA